MGITRSDFYPKATISSAAAGATELDISGIDDDWTIFIKVAKLTAASGTPQARLSVEDSVNAFSADLAGPSVSLQGPIATAESERTWSFKKADFPSLRTGDSSAVLRLNVLELGGTTVSLTVHGFIEY